MGLTTLLGIGLATSAASTIANSVASPILQNSANNKQFEQNKQLMQYQNDLQMKTWQAQQNQINEYNDPSNQLKRMENAGINPNMIGEVQGNYSSVSPEASVGLASTNPQSLMPDMSGFSEFAKAALQGQDLDIKSKAVDVQDKVAENSVAVGAQQIKNLMAQEDKTRADIDNIKTQTTALNEQVKQKYESLQQGWYDMKLKFLRYGLDSYRNRWEEEVAKYNSATDRSIATTQRYNYNLAKEQFHFETQKFDKEFNFKVNQWKMDFNKWIAEYKRGNVDKVLDIMKSQTQHFKIGDLIEFDYQPIPDIINALSFVDSWSKEYFKLPSELSVELAPIVDRTLDSLNSVEIKAKKANPFGKVYAPWYNKDNSSYINNKDMSDAF